MGIFVFYETRWESRQISVAKNVFFLNKTCQMITIKNNFWHVRHLIHTTDGMSYPKPHVHKHWHMLADIHTRVLSSLRGKAAGKTRKRKLRFSVCLGAWMCKGTCGSPFMGVNVHLAVHVLASVVSLKQALLIAERTKQNVNSFSYFLLKSVKCTLYLSKVWGWERFFQCFWKVSYSHQKRIYLIKNIRQYCEMLLQLKNNFSILLYFKK